MGSDGECSIRVKRLVEKTFDDVMDLHGRGRMVTVASGDHPGDDDHN